MNTNPIALDALKAKVKADMRRAYNLGQLYWQQADSDFTSQHKKSDETATKFSALCEETCAAIAALEAEPPEQETARDWTTAQDWRGMDGVTAFHLIQRHADGWGDVGAMMNAWLAAQAEPQPEHEKNTARLAFLQKQMLAADFDYGGECVLVFRWPRSAPVGADLIRNIDAALPSTPPKD
jgi:hypothetical protein